MHRTIHPQALELCALGGGILLLLLIKIARM